MLAPIPWSFRRHHGQLPLDPLKLSGGSHVNRTSHLGE
jgi:hypothetical protein